MIIFTLNSIAANNVKNIFKTIFCLSFFILNNSIYTKASIVVNSINTSTSTCENNGTATINAVSTPNPFLLYKIVSGPTLSNFQSSNVFSSLYPGNYTARLYDVNFDSVEVQFTVTGNYQLPFCTPELINPTCVGFTDGAIIGNADSSKGLPPFTWEIISPITVPSQPSDTFNNLAAGSYQIRMTDACGNFQTRTAILSNDGTGLGLFGGSFFIPNVVKIGCDTIVVGTYINLYTDQEDLPLTLTIVTSAGTTTSTIYVQPYPTVTDFGTYYISDTIANLTYGDYLQVVITDVCGVSVYSAVNQIAPYYFYPTFYPYSGNCSLEIGAYMTLPYYPNYYFDYTSINAPVTYSLTNSSSAIVDSGTITYYTNGATLQPQTLGELYHFTITDGCGQMFEQDIVFPLADTPKVQSYVGVGCLDNTASVGFSFQNFLSGVTLEITSGPSFVQSTKPGYAFYDTITYPKIYPGININNGGFNIKNLAEGTYTYTVYDSCGTSRSGSFTVYDYSLANFNYVYSIKRACQGNNTLYFDAQLVNANAVSLQIFSGATGALLLNRYPVPYGLDSLNSLPAGDYIINIFYGYSPLVGGQVYNASLSDNISDCWVLVDTITIPPFSDNSFQSNTSITCNGTTYVELVVDSTNGVPPYQYEIIAGPQTAPLQISNLFTLQGPGNYLFRVSDACGNSFIQQLTISTDTFPPIIKQGNFCVGASINLIATPSAYFSYQWEYPNGTIYNGNILNINPLTVADTGLYTVAKYVNINGCVDTFYSSYNVNFVNDFNISATICTGNFYPVGNNNYNTTGFYSDTLTSLSGCDSIVNLNLLVTDFKRDSLTINLCGGDSIVLGGITYNQTGIYIDTISTITCDSIFKLDLTVLDFKRDTINAQICQGGSYNLGGNIYTTTGNYTDTLSTNTCDSIVLLNLLIVDFLRDTISASICNGNTYLLGGNNLSLSGTYSDTLSTSTCDSIVILNLIVTDFLRDTISASICNGNTYSFGGNNLSVAGTYADTLSTTTCDSIVILNLIVNDFLRDTISASTCVGFPYLFGGNNISVAGFYSDTLSTSTCDSIVTLNLSITDFLRDTISAFTCVGFPYSFNGNNLTVAGFYSDTLSTSTCDSIVTLNLTLTDFLRDTISAFTCVGFPYSFGGNNLTVAGLYSDTLSTSTCDSIITLNLTLIDYLRDTVSASTCIGFPYSFNGNSLTTAGTYSDTLTTATCDSIVTLNLTLTDYLRDTVSASTCIGFPYSFNGNNISVAGIYSDTLSTSTCDSIITLNLTFTDFLRDTISAAICSGDFYSLGSNQLSSNGIFTDTLSSSTCDSIIILNLTVAPYKRDTINFTICANDSITIENITYSQSGTFTDTISTSTCDSILQININVLQYGYDTIFPNICDNEFFIIGNSSYNTTGAYTDTFPTIGCDSIITIYLTVYNSPSVNIIVSDTIVTNGDLITLNTNTYNVNYQWSSIASLNSYTIQNPNATITESSWIYLIVENNFGCIAQDSVYILAKELECSERNIYVPNAFSPNGDGINDKFFAVARNVEFEEMQIFNRWGQIVFQTTDIRKSWDGTFKKEINPDVYVYWIKYKGCNDELLKGTILLLQ